MNSTSVPGSTSTKVVELETGRLWPDAQAAAAAKGVGALEIHAAASAGGTCAGSHWAFAGDPALGKLLGEHGSKKLDNAPRRRKRVEDLEDGRVYPSVAAAAEKTGFAEAAIYRACASARKKKPSRFIYKGEVSHAAAKKRYMESKRGKAAARGAISQAGGSLTGSSRKPFEPVAVVCLDTGVIYDSVARASEQTGVKAKRIYDALRFKCRAGGFWWARAQEVSDIPAELERRREGYWRGLAKRGLFPPRPVRCVETGEVFPSIRAAARAVGVACTSNISEAILKGRRAGGFHWQYEGAGELGEVPPADAEIADENPLSLLREIANSASELRLAELADTIEDLYLPLPLSVDGAPLRPGETFRDKDGAAWTVAGYLPGKVYDVIARGEDGAEKELKSSWLRREPPSIESLLGDFARAMSSIEDDSEGARAIADFAEKIREAR